MGLKPAEELRNSLPVSTLRNRTMFGDYDRFYQNYVPGAVTADKRRVALTAYNNATQRRNMFNQTDVICPVATGRLRHTLHGSYTVSYLPSSGDQFSSLTTITEQAKPEQFDNYEVGVKWEPHSGLAVTSALYRLDRTTTRSTDPNDPTRIVQTGSQRTSGFEVGITGRVSSAWQVAGGYAHQDAYVTSATTAARAGARVAQVPHHTLSLWNHYQLLPRLGAAVGVLFRTDQQHEPVAGLRARPAGRGHRGVLGLSAGLLELCPCTYRKVTGEFPLQVGQVDVEVHGPRLAPTPRGN